MMRLLQVLLACAAARPAASAKSASEHVRVPVEMTEFYDRTIFEVDLSENLDENGKIIWPEKRWHGWKVEMSAMSFDAVWKSTCETYLDLHAIKLSQLRGRRRIDGVEPPRHRADAVTGTTSRRWHGASEI